LKNPEPVKKEEDDSKNIFVYVTKKKAPVEDPQQAGGL